MKKSLLKCIVALVLSVPIMGVGIGVVQAAEPCKEARYVYVSLFGGVLEPEDSNLSYLNINPKWSRAPFFISSAYSILPNFHSTLAITRKLLYSFMVKNNFTTKLRRISSQLCCSRFCYYVI